MKAIIVFVLIYYTNIFGVSEVQKQMSETPHPQETCLQQMDLDNSFFYSKKLNKRTAPKISMGDYRIKWNEIMPWEYR